MAKFTREQAKETARKALSFKRQYGSYTVVVVGDEGFNTTKATVQPSELIEGGKESNHIHKKYKGNVVIRTYTNLQSSGLNIDTIEGLSNTIYQRVNALIEEINLRRG